MKRRVTMLVLVLALAAGAWTYLWFGVARRAEAEVERRMAQIAEHGIRIGCAERKFGGFPFRLELDCVKPSFDLDGTGRVFANAERLQFVSMVWAPFRFVVLAEGPLVGRTPETVEPVRGAWSSARASLDFSTDRVRRISVEFTDFVLGPGSAAAMRLVPRVAVKRLELHGRPNGGAAGGDVDFAGRAVDLDVILADGRTLPLVSFEFDTTVRKALPFLLRSGHPGDLLKAWQAAGGRIDIHRLRGELGDTALAEGSGRIGADAVGRIEGRFDARMAGLERLLAPAGGVIARLGPKALGAEAELDGRSARAVKVRITEGRVMIGPVGIGDLPPLF